MSSISHLLPHIFCLSVLGLHSHVSCSYLTSPVSHIRYCLKSSVSCLLSTVSCILSFSRVLSYVSCLTSIVCLMSPFCLISPICLTSPVCLRPPVCLTSPVSHLLSVSELPVPTTTTAVNCKRKKIEPGINCFYIYCMSRDFQSLLFSSIRAN